MGLETGSFIDQLDPNNPTPNDPKSQGDDHLRLIKSVLQSQFTSLGEVAVTATAEELNRAGIGTIAQKVFITDSTVKTGETTLSDNALPTILDGDEFMAIEAFTPKYIDSILEIEVYAMLTEDGIATAINGALFIDDISNAIGAGWGAKDAGANRRCLVAFKAFYTVPGVLDPIRVSFRAGQAGGVTFNGVGGTVRFGGVSASTLTVTEYKA